MLFLLSFGAVALLSSKHVSALPVTEQINPRGLLGSHFGVPGNASYDYVVVGGGTGGLAIATRLAEANHTVAVIEAGSYYEMGNGLRSTYPSDDTYYSGTNPTDVNPVIDWNITTIPQVGAQNRRVHYARGKCLGGSSARNFLIYQRGSAQSYQMWADQVGDQSYTFDNFRPFFERSVTLTEPNMKLRAANASASWRNDALRPDGPPMFQGPVQISFPNTAAPMSSWYQKAFREKGIADAEDFNSGKLMGSQYDFQTIDPRSATRSSAETSYLRQAFNGSGLIAFPSTMAKRIMFDKDKKATGVVVNSAGMEYILAANKEVILSAGAFQSPQMLMVSGIGPEETLKQHKIPVVAALPGVGQNMWDHILYGPSYQVSPTTHSSLFNPRNLPIQVAAFMANQTSLLGNNGVDYLAWEKLPDANRKNMNQASVDSLKQFPADWPELEYLTSDGFVGRQNNLLDNGLPVQAILTNQYSSILAALVAPLSRGNVTIASADSADLPLVNPNWLSHPTDQQVAVEGYKRAREFFSATSIKPVLIGEEVFPGSKVQSDDDILKTIQQSFNTVWHASCTCKMGKKDDPQAVVDSNARVYGVKGLRVVDASAFPLLPPGHPQSTVYALAEKIADDIIKGN